MRLFRNFFTKEPLNPAKSNRMLVTRDKQGRAHVAMHSTIFSDVNENILASNSMFADLLNDIQPCIEPYSVKEKIVMDVFETKVSNDFARDTVIIGFKRYVNSCLYGLKKQHLSRFFLFFSFLVFGVLIEFILYFLVQKYVGAEFTSHWLFKSVEVLGTLFIWQFGGYLAFEFLGERKQLNRYKQIANIEFEFKHWD